MFFRSLTTAALVSVRVDSDVVEEAYPELPKSQGQSLTP